MSRTELMQQFIDDRLTRQLVEARNAADFSGAAEEIRASLLDPATLATPDFLLRRHIFRTYPQLSEKWPDLTDNAPWDAKITNYTVKLLCQTGQIISPKVWRAYLRGESLPDTRMKALRLAVMTRMDLDTAQAFLMSLEMPTLNMRFPLDFLCYPAFRNPKTITWAQIEDGLEGFRTRHGKDFLPASKLGEGETRLLESSMEQMIRCEENVAERLKQYMDGNAGYFLNTQQKELAAYSKTTQAKFLRICKMLAILYPYYHDKFNGRSSIHMGNFQLVETDADGIPCLRDLAKAMLFLDGWRQIWNTDPGQEGRKMDKLESYFYSFQDSFADHMSKVDNAIRGTGSQHAFFTRNDALLFAYYFIQGYRNLCDGIETSFELDAEYHVDPDTENPNWSSSADAILRERYDGKKEAMKVFFAGIATADEKKAQLDALLGTSDDEALLDIFDDSIAEVMDRWDRFCCRKNAAEPREMYEETLNALDIILDALGQRKIYVLSKVDRLFLLALLSDSPSELLPLVISPQFKANYDTANKIGSQP